MVHRKPITAIILGLFFIFYVAACAKILADKEAQRSEAVTPSSSSTSTIVFTHSPSQSFSTNTASVELPTKTKTSTLTSIPFPTVTPTSTQYLRTPTFDLASIATATKSPNAICPKVDVKFKPLMPDQEDVGIIGNYPFDQITLQNSILKSLNQGATIPALQSALTKATGNGNPLEIKPSELYLKELTGDTVPEVVFDSYFRFSIFTCLDGNYILGVDIPSNGLYLVSDVAYKDLDRDNVPEIIVLNDDNVAVVVGYSLAIFSWNGSAFQNLSDTEEIIASETLSAIRVKAFPFYQASKYKISDVDKNGTLDLVIRDDYIGTHAEAPWYGPWRIITHIITWNGTKFVLLPPKFDPPVYRFQAVQDGDRALFRGDYEEAFKSYNQALNDLKLKGWSEAHFKNMQAAIEADWKGKATPTALPDDPAEYSTLTAYARFHIILTYLLEGNRDQAHNEYAKLLNDYSSGQPGFAFVELAQIFWETYVKTGSLSKACSDAGVYARNHPDETTNQIDLTWHGWQSPGYYPYISPEKIICPVE